MYLLPLVLTSSWLELPFISSRTTRDSCVRLRSSSRLRSCRQNIQGLHAQQFQLAWFMISYVSFCTLGGKMTCTQGQNAKYTYKYNFPITSALVTMTEPWNKSNEGKLMRNFKQIMFSLLALFWKSESMCKAQSTSHHSLLTIKARTSNADSANTRNMKIHRD
jgi:hypothetical protein